MGSENNAGGRRSGFTLMELLVAVSVLAILVGILLPVVSRARMAAVAAGCSSNLRQIGIAVGAYCDANGDHFPSARYMPLPFFGVDTDPPLTKVLAVYVGNQDKVFKCPGDQDYVFSRCGMSYVYDTYLSGRTIGSVVNNPLFVREGAEVTEGELPVLYDCDNGMMELMQGEILVPKFHAKRNFLYADAHIDTMEPKVGVK